MRIQSHAIIIIIILGFSFFSFNIRPQYPSPITDTQIIDIIHYEDRIIVVGNTNHRFESFGNNFRGHNDGFIQVFDLQFNPLWGRYIGGVQNDQIIVAAVDVNGSIIVTGRTTSRYWVDPVRGQNTGYEDIFVVKLTPDGTELWVVFFGGKEGDIYEFEAPTAIAVNGTDIFVGGYSYNPDFPDAKVSTNSEFPLLQFIIKLNETGSRDWTSAITSSWFDDLRFISVDDHIHAGYCKTVAGLVQSNQVVKDEIGDVEGESDFYNAWEFKDAVLLNYSAEGEFIDVEIKGGTEFDCPTAEVQFGGRTLVGSTRSDELGDYHGGINDIFVERNGEWVLLGGSGLDGLNRLNYGVYAQVVDDSLFVAAPSSSDDLVVDRIFDSPGELSTYIVMLDLDLKEIKSILIGSSEVDVITALRYVNGKILVGGYTEEKNGNRFGFIHVLDKELNLERSIHV